MMKNWYIDLTALVPYKKETGENLLWQMIFVN